MDAVITKRSSYWYNLALAIGVIALALVLLPSKAEAAPVGNVTDIEEQSDGRTYEILAGKDKVKVIFYRDDMVRIWLGVNGTFTEPGGKKLPAPTVPIVDAEPSDFDAPTLTQADEGEYFKLESGELVLRVYKQPLRFAMYKKDNATLIWEETKALDYGSKTVQTLSRGEDEYFYGGGLQHGAFSHRDQKIKIEFGGGWDSGAVSNPSPFYMSTNGYGMLRNTFQVGSYDFKEPLLLSHDENRFDAFYFYGESMREILDGYTDLTGKPTLIPRWALGLGDANCYNRDPQTTKDVVGLIAQKYREYDMPGSWILPNDGYGCGYTNLKETVDELKELGFHTGLWTENGVAKIADEVGNQGTRAAKLDVAWVGPGYDFALNATKTTYDGIENNSDARAYIWSVGGWAGTQRYSAVWTGDQSGNWEYIRFHIPTYIGGGLSGIPYVTSDVDGIFGGSAKTQVRDLQWKVFTPLFLNMSGWAAKDKQPWVWGEPYTSYNREYLKLKQRLTPYLYTYLNESYEYGAPLVRGMVYEFPDDPNTKGKLTQYQFMSGESFLVAPVYSDTNVRHNIYLPKGKWIDYWTGENHYGSKMLNDYSAPLDTLPLLVKAGAIIPMYPESLYDGQVPPNPITYDMYPYGESSFELYEDDGLTKEHRQGRFAKTIIESIAPTSGMGDLLVNVGASVGDYNGKLASRVNQFTIHMANKPTGLAVDGAAYAELVSLKAWEDAPSGWYYDAADRGGILYVKTTSMPTDKSFLLVVNGFEADETPLADAEVIVVPGVDTDPTRIPQADMTASASSADSLNPAAGVLDENRETIWSAAAGSALPQSITVDLGIGHSINRVKVLPRQYGGDSGIITKYKLYVSSDGTNFTEVAGGDWKADKTEKTISFDTVQASFVRIEALEGTGGTATISELNVYRDPEKPSPILIPKAELKATTTSFQSGSEASKAIDGDPNTVWHTKWDLSDKLPQSITLDLGKTRKINQFRYGPRMDSGNGTITSYKLYVSTDGTNYTMVSSGSWVRNNKLKYVTFDAVAARYVKLEAIAAVGGFASAREVDVYEAPVIIDDEIKLISQGKSATASSADPSMPAVNGNDGDAETRWSAADASAGQSYSIDLGKNFSIRSLEVAFQHPDKVYKYKLEVREAGNPNWITVVDRTANTEAGALLTNNFGSLGRYARLTITGLPDAESRASFWEMKLYGAETNTGGDGEFITGVSLNKGEIDLFVNGAYEIVQAIVEPATALNKKVTWASGNTAVAVVDNAGKVTPVGPGTTTITVTTEEGGWTASAAVTVHPEPTGEAESELIPKAGMTATATSEQTGNGEGADKAIDGDPGTMWHVRYFGVDPLPQSITINLGGEYNVNKVAYLPRQTGSNGLITMYNVYTSLDGVTFKKAASGTWANNSTEKFAVFPGVRAAYVKLEAVEGNGGFAAAAEVSVFQGEVAAELPLPSVSLKSNTSVKEKEQFPVTFGLQHLDRNVMAQDVTIAYDSDRFAFKGAQSLLPGVNLIQASDAKPGEIRLIIVSEGLQNAIDGDRDIIELTFEALEGVEEPAEVGRIQSTRAVLADEHGAEFDALAAMLDIQVNKEIIITVPGDVNGDGKASIGDLAIVAFHYGKNKETSADWNVAKIADMDNDGDIDLDDLVRVASRIIQ